MADANESANLRNVLKACIKTTEKRKEEATAQRQATQGDLSQSTPTAINAEVNQQFSLDVEREALMKDIAHELEHTLKDGLERLSKVSRNYLLDHLCENGYDADQKKFVKLLNEDSLETLRDDLVELLPSMEAFEAAWNGNKTQVENYLNKYPSAKDKTGLWGTTLLYSAARNNRFDVVKYLVDEAKCSIDAQNQQHVKRALAVKIQKEDNIQRNPSAGSTALHGACFNGHLEIVKFLVERGANYFIRNHADETAIMHAEKYPPIVDYFRGILVLGYSKKTTGLPYIPILEDAKDCVFDCMWEYKPFSDQRWFPFSKHEANQLQQCLLIKPDATFKREIHLKVQNGIYVISLLEFLRSGKNNDLNQKPAWIRCRGSSIANFKCYALWQIMLSQHPKAKNDPSMKMFRFPTSYDSRFELQLSCWYFVDARVVDALDNAMKNRRKYLRLAIDKINSNKILLFNLEDFTFSDEEKTIRGYIRWLPKMISEDSRHKDKIIGYDEFETLGHSDIIPLTVQHLKDLSGTKDIKSTDNIDGDTVSEDYTDDFDADGDIADTHVFEDDDDLGGSSYEDYGKDAAQFSALNDYVDDREPEDIVIGSTTDSQASMSMPWAATRSSISSSSSDGDRPMEDFINEAAANYRSDEQEKIKEIVLSTDDSKVSGAMKKEISKLKDDNDHLQSDLNDKISKIKQLEADAKQAGKYAKELNDLKDRVKEMEKKQQDNQKKQEKINTLLKSIKTIEYTNIHRELIQKVFTPRSVLILKYLRDTCNDIDPFLADRIPQLWFDEKKGNYIITIAGVQKQHDEFKLLRERILSLSNVIQSAKDFHQRKSKQLTKTLIKDTMNRIRPRTSNWIEYTTLFTELFQLKNKEYQQKFEDFIEEKMKELLDRCIMKKLDKPWIEVQRETDNFIRKHSLLEEVDETKQKAMVEFIEKNISSQSHKFETKPSQKSREVLQNFIARVKKEFRQENQYKGHHLKSFSGIPKLLQRLMLYYSSFKIQLPLYESCEDLLGKIDKNAITTISTSTGSGKSTLLPALLIADGYDKVIVTQPRRLPCQLICKRVNQTMLSEIRSVKEPLAGWAVSGAQQNPQAKVIYLTDGLLKERLLYDKGFITKNTNLNKSVVFFIDEVHERSVNIDTCLALLARLLTIEPELKSKMKVIISSATLNLSVPDLFRKIPQAGLAEFKMPSLGTLHPVVKNHRPNENVLDIVQELCKKRKRHDQILCFVSSVSEVNQSCRLINEISHGTIVAHPLVQSQHPNVQQDFIENGTVFFSTTVAETSLTFPSLKYVIDTGMINIPVYDSESKRTVLKEMRAAESTIKQRLGRLGRTQPGEYYSVYDFKIEDLRFPVPQIRQSDLMNIEFSLRKSPLKNGLDYLKQFLPDPPTPKDITITNGQLEALGIIKKGSSNQLTSHGEDLAKLPDFGSLAMSKAVLAALRDYKCGLDLIRLSAILGVLNTTVLFKSIPINMKSADGDFMTLLNVMKAVLSVRQSCSPRQINIDEVCRTKGLLEIRHVIRQALRRYTTLETTFKRSPEFRQQAHIESNDWSLIARALLAGFSDNVFVSLKKLHSKQLQFIRYNGSGDIAILDLQSTLTRPISEDPVDFVLARDIRHSTAVRDRAVLSFVGELQASWVGHIITREMSLTAEDETYLNSSNIYKSAQSKFADSVSMSLSNNRVSMRGSAGSVLNAELHLRQEMVHENTFMLAHLSGGKPHANFQRNLESIMKMPYIFKPMIWRWQAERQVKIEVNPDTANKTCQVSVRGKRSDFLDVKKEFDTFIRWLQPCAVIRHPNAGISPRVLRPAMRKTCKDIEERISRVTDPNRTPVDLHHGVKGTRATRETRMEVVAWIAICKFNCKVEGGFVRDWIVGHYVSRPAGGAANPKSWIQYAGKIPGLNKEVVPCDIDCHLSTHDYFSIEKFQDELYKLDISCTVIREDWRYILLLDEDAPTGPFTMDLIEPHVALTHDRIDLDVNNLSVEKDYTHELGMRIDIQSRPYSIELETVVDNIKNKRFQVLRPIDNIVQDRMNKMIQTRGWTHTGQVFSIIPEPHFKQNAILVPLPKGSLYSQIVNEMQTISSLQIISIEQIRNPILEETYEGMKKIIKRQCPHDDPNETELFHGTGGDGIKGIVEDGYDDRYFSSGGLYGHGAYFADNPVKSHSYTALDPTDGTRVMFYNKVCLGKSHVLTATNSSLVSAPVGFHSVIGKHNNLTEYIVYRYGQALPYLKIVYKG